MSTYNVVIIGAGPTGLGAAHRLQELGEDNFVIVEARNYPGGLASSFQDTKGFWWDIGGHVQFSHYEYFDRLMDALLPNQWLYHERESWIWIKDRFIPYPFQLNIHRLPPKEQKECLDGLIALHKNPPKKKPQNFEEWILQTAGTGIAKYFLLPYNFKVWAYPPKDLNTAWVGQRVATTDLQRVQDNIAHNRDDVSWGPNNLFRFPKYEGTGSIWKALAATIPSEKLLLNHTVSAVDINTHTLVVNGQTMTYDHLLSTMPLDQLIARSDYPDKSKTDNLLHSSTHIVGLGLSGKPPEHLQKKCWMYFPEDNCPFYRVTVFSNYSPNNVPDIQTQWSLMFEVAQSPVKPVNRQTIVEHVIKGALNTKLITTQKDIVSTWQHYEPYGYPTPSLHRDASLELLTDLDKQHIYSRGRFGAWKYEVSNQDHSLMQGVEVVDRIINNKPETTLWHPEIVNMNKK